MDALLSWIGSEWKLLRFGHGCSASTDGVGVDVITDAFRERIGVEVDVIAVRALMHLGKPRRLTLKPEC